MMTIKPGFMRWLSRGAVVGAFSLILVGAAQVTPALPTVDLSIGPVAVNSQAVNIALALSVEFPTVGAAYRTPAYEHTKKYIGYWDDDGCYSYRDGTSGAPLSGEYFFRNGNVDADRYCNTAGSGTGYSGNLLNYVATSSIDLLRYGLTGGDRVADTTDTTILARAYLYNGWQLHSGNNFPVHRIPATFVGKVTPSYTGIVNQDVYGGSCLDRVWFGVSNASANCNTPGTSGNLNQSTIDPLSTTTLVVDAGSPAPAFSVFQTTTFYVTNPLTTSTFTPTFGPITFNDTIILGVGTSTTPVPGNPPGSFITNTYIANGGTTTTTPIAPSPTNVIGITTVPFAQRNFQNFLPSSGLFRAFTLSSSVNVCRSSNSTTPLSFVGLLDASGNPTGVSNSSCGSGVYTGYSSRGGVTVPRTVYEPLQARNVYSTYDKVAVYRPYSVIRAFDDYILKDEYIKFGTKIGIMYARVRVCDSSERTTRTDLCARYPDGNYKPIGEIQRNAEATRVAAFGYVADNNINRYGAALRAPMRFTGPSYRDADGVQQINGQPEWNVNNGIFATDPLGVSPTFATSGVINYLNKFGTTGTKGYYKTYDAMGELYYETLRYFQGLGPSPAALTGLVDASYDGFPVYDTAAASPKTLAGWVDPVQNACQRRNFILTISDNNTHNDKQLPGHKSPNGVNEILNDLPRVAEPLFGDGSKVFNAVDWTAILTGFETGVSRSYVDALGNAQNTLGNPNVRSANTNLEGKCTGATCSAYYWAGAAYWANTQSIRLDSKAGQSMKDVRVKTFSIDVDENGNGSIEDNSSAGIKPRSSATYLAGKYGWFSDANRDGNPFKTSGGQTNNSEWEDPLIPNTPDGYVIASQAQKMLDGIRKFFSAATSEKGAVSVSSLSSQRFTTQEPNGDLFAPRFDTRDWSGTVQRSSLRLNTLTGTIDTTAGVRWDSGLILTQASLTTTVALDPYVKPADRNIFTMARGVSSSSGQAFSVANKGNFDAAVSTALNTSPTASVLDNQIDGRINWLRGDRSNEQNSSGGLFRRRARIMGDVINSGPVFKQGADPDARGAGYTEFAEGVASRTPMIYVGANDGMMHGFRATDGKELFAYIPRAVAENLNQLTNPKYVHRPYVDGVPAVNEAQVGTAWKTILASGMGGGAQGIFALDVTNPNSFGAGNVLFEFTDQDDADMGNVLSQPKIVKMKMAGTGPTVYKWFIAVGSGYNNYKIDGTNYSATGRQALFLLSLDKTPSQAWALGTNYFKVMLPDPASTTTPNGLANPSFAKGAFGEALFLYAGDLQGNMWRFNFANGLSSSTTSTALKVISGSGVPIAIAKDSAGNRQPITVSPVVTTGFSSGYIVTFGTGKFVEPSDSSTAGRQSMYGVWDSFSTVNSDYEIGRSKLYARSINEGTISTTVTGSDTFIFGNGSTGTYRGWYADLPTTGERVATEGATGLGFVAFNSTIPDGTCSGDGTGRSMCFGSLYGQAACDFKLSKAGLLSRPNVISTEDSTIVEVYSARTSTGRRNAIVKQSLLSTGTKISDAGTVDSSTSQVSTALIPGGRVSWREVRNFKGN